MVSDESKDTSLTTPINTEMESPIYNAFPLSFAQQRIWFLEQLNQQSSLYNMPSALRVKGDLDIGILWDVIKKIINRHEVLRTIFVEVDNKIYQKILSPLSTYKGHLIDFTKSTNKEYEVQLYLNKFVKTIFDLKNGPLIKIEVMQVSVHEYILLFNAHHIIFDGASTNILLYEIINLYASNQNNQAYCLPTLELQYVDYCLWEKELFEQGEIDKQLAFWKDKLTSIPVNLFPSDKNRPNIKNYQGKEISFQFTSRIHKALKDISNKNKATLFMTLLAGFYALLYRYNLGNDLCVGIPVANRSRTEFELLIGLFVNTLPIRVNFSEEITFNELINIVKETLLEAHANQDTPFEYLINKFVKERDLSITPIVQIMFAYEKQSNELPKNMFKFDLEPIELQTNTSKFDLTLTIRDEEENLFGAFEFSTDLFEDLTINRFIKNFLNLLDEIVKCPSKKISQLNFLSIEELSFYQDNQTNNVAEESLNKIFVKQVKKYGSKTAVSSNQLHISYDELNRRSNQFARYLLDKNIKSGELIGICLNRSIETIISILAVVKAGGSYLPIEPTIPSNRIEYILQNSMLRYLISSDDVFKSQNQHITTIETKYLGEMINPFDDSDIDINIDINQQAYVIYTSGTTGNPKGVSVSHKNIIRLFQNTAEDFKFDHHDIWILFHSIAFDFSVWEMWGALLFGGKLIIPTQDICRSPVDFYQLMIKEKVTILNQTPSAFKLLISADKDKNEKLMHLRLIIFGGEKLNFSLLQNWVRKYGYEKPLLVNMYGITETTVHVTYHVINSNDLLIGKSLIGKPISDMNIFVCDKHMNLLPKGAMGEFYIAGAGVSRGYLNNTALTNEKFIEHSFFNDNIIRLYKSGDVGRLTYMQYEYIGRIDNQIKIRGFRIELSEIEECINNFDQVNQSVVLFTQNQTLSAYVAVDRPKELSLQKLYAYLQDSLPVYMIPSAYAILETLPINSNGKIDNNQLANIVLNTITSNDAKKPTTEVEKLLANIWQDMLGISSISVNDNFFNVGGDSIKILEVIAKAKKQGVQIEVIDIYKHQTIAKIAMHISEDLSVNLFTTSYDNSNLPANLPVNISDSYPLSSLQEGMIYHSKLQPDSGVYHDIFSFQIKLNVNQTILREVINIIVAKYPILRTSFHMEDSFYQYVHKNIEPYIVFYDFTKYAEQVQLEKFKEWLELEKQNYFEFDEPKLIRFFIHVLNKDDIQFTISFHHAILDGWSLTKLVTELFNNYNAALENNLLNIEHNVPNIFRNYVLLEKQVIGSEEYQQYWQNQVRDFSFTPLPRWHAQEKSYSRQNEMSVLLHEQLSYKLMEISKSLNVPLKTILFTTHIAVLAYLLNVTDIMTGIATNCRLEDEYSGEAIGLFLNTLAFRIQLKDISWQELIYQVYEAELDNFKYRYFPLNEIIKLNNNRDLFEVVFNFVHFYSYKELNQEIIKDVKSSSFYEETNFPLVVNFSQNPFNNSLSLTLCFHNDEFCEEQIRLICGYYLKASEQITTHPEQRFLRQHFLSVEEYRQIVFQFNDNIRSISHASLHEQFEAQVKKLPNKTAVVFDSCSLTYAELNKRVNQLCHLLMSKYKQENGFKNKNIILCLHPGIQRIICLLSIVKLGGIYIPIAYEDPVDRINNVLEKIDINLFLTDKFLYERFSESINCSIICIDFLEKQIINESFENLPCHTTGDDLLYVMFTSGSTGIPKGVMIKHKSVIRLIHEQNDINFTEEDVVGQFSNMAFDASTFEIWGALLNGACLVIAEKNIILDFARFNHFITSNNITVAFFTTGLFKELVQYEKLNFSNINYLVVGGEKLSSGLIQKFVKNPEYLPTHLLNGYGPTENTVFTTYYLIKYNNIPSSSSIPIGRFLCNTIGYVLNSYSQLVPIGTVGELYIGGEGLSLGYMNQEKLTDSSFITNPFYTNQLPNSYSKLYRTGDLVRWLPDGTLEYLRRIDNQIKLRGFRIELEEIENVLLKYPHIQDCSILTKLINDESVIIAFCILKNKGITKDIAPEIKNYLSHYLPSYMLPTHICFLDKFLLTINGKIDKASLAILQLDLNNHESITLPKNEIENHLCVIFQELLGIKFISTHANYFSLGVHSLLSTRILIKINLVFSLDLKLGVIFEHNTIHELANFIRPLLTYHQNLASDANEQDYEEFII